jgi:hypothetical protein
VVVLVVLVGGDTILAVVAVQRAIQEMAAMAEVLFTIMAVLVLEVAVMGAAPAAVLALYPIRLAVVV